MSVLKKPKKDEYVVQVAKGGSYTPVDESIATNTRDAFTTNQRFASVVAFPAAVTFALGLAYFTPHMGIPPEMGVFIVFLVSIASVIFLERLIPRDLSWRMKVGRDTQVDATSLAVVMGIVDPVLKGAWPLIAAAILAGVGYSGGEGVFPNTWPFLLKVGIAVLVAGFGQYWLHRFAHEWPPMWRFHSLHHSAKRIYWLNGFRVHPLNVLWHQAAGFLVLLLLDADRMTLNGFLSLTVVVSVFQHANARLSLGWLNYVFSTNELHRWHHSTKISEANSNYGAVLSVWDILFGTFHHDPHGRPSQLGLSSKEIFPSDSYWKQLWQPFWFWLRNHGPDPDMNTKQNVPSGNSSKE